MAFLLIDRVLVTAFSAKTPPRMGVTATRTAQVVTLLLSLVETDSEMLAPMARLENYPRAALPIAVNSLDRG
jgi:hypothetical protein